MHIRKATKDDAAVAFEIRNLAILAQCKGHYEDETLQKWTEGSLPAHFVTDFAANGYVSIMNDNIVGVGMINLTTGMVDAMFVRPEYIGQGFGKQMIQYLELQARKAQCKKLSLDASLNAVDFYRACGFEGQREAIFYSPRGIELTCLPMTKALL
ncbi:MULTISPECIES: GNAT family N-acetyltransferase [Shewanella]|uniref:N-acetyltransferase n=1 Tax=Shewanella japonica TaxID=93973 RepID=A0ABM6JMQ1_9GAMM|nr:MULTISPECIES: GNAT family N-acetyltransferase [Shewanella]ARD23071.1 N-acetyltransferase [Shewanella japonica]KPZ68001.1 Aminoglycoside N(6')-acetyltransferase type 1 [Shewanella sp. P1-14-1]